MRFSIWVLQLGHPGNDRRARSRGHLALDPHPGAAHRGAAVQAARADAAAHQSGKGTRAQVVTQPMKTSFGNQNNCNSFAVGTVFVTLINGGMKFS